MSGLVAVWAVLILATGALAYLVSERFGRSRGVTPWRLPSSAWALIAVASTLLLPLVLLALPVACLTTNAPDPGPARAQASEVGPGDVGGPTAGGAGGQPAAPAVPPPPRDLPLFGWYADPSGRHQHRYWDGRCWTEHVRDDGVRGIDPPV